MEKRRTLLAAAVAFSALVLTGCPHHRRPGPPPGGPGAGAPGGGPAGGPGGPGPGGGGPGGPGGGPRR